jgi:Protein of unknown function DUF262/Protein of unknown function (DUF1524)
MIRSVNKYQISEIFSTERAVIYNVPRYQREYTWGASQWEELFDDINEKESGYFLGSIICIDQSTDTLQNSRLEVVDGQQRLTTLSLLFAALYTRLSLSLDESIRSKVNTLKNRLILEDSDEVLRLTPQKQNHNLDDYLALLHEIGLISERERPANAGNRKITKAYRYFENRLDSLMTNDQGYAEVLAFLNKAYQACLVKIEVLTHSDAYTLFETLNNRGAPLTAVDLIKNKLLSKLENTNLERHFERWNRLITQLGDDYAIQERFFRQYYNSFKNELNSSFRAEDGPRDPLGTLATRSNLIQIYERLIDNEPNQFLEKLYEASNCYAMMLSTGANELSAQLEKEFQNIDHVQAAPAYVLLMNLLVYQERYELTENQLERLISILVSFFVRRNVTDTPPTRDITRLFMRIIDQIEHQRGDQVYNTVLHELQAVSTSDEIFSNKLKGPIYEENPGIARFILCYLAEQGMTLENNVDLWLQDGKQYRWTIEHIFPQGQNIPQSWVDMIAGGDQATALSHQKEYVHQLGNLTITAYNSSLSNKSFQDKRDRIDRNGNFVGFKNRLNLNTQLASTEAWTIEQIQARTNDLQRKVLHEFNIHNTI